MPSLTKKTINLTPRAGLALERIKDQDGYNDTDTINRALILVASLIPYRDGDTLTVEGPDGQTLDILMI